VIQVKSTNLKKRGRIWGVCSLITAMMLVVAACGSGGGTAKPASTQPVSGQAGEKKAEVPKVLSVKDIYNGADRDQLEKKAKEEGKIALYTSMNVEDLQPITDAFEKKYGVKVEAWRAADEKVTQRAITEYKANRFDVDMIDTDSPSLEIVYREQLTEPFDSPYFKDLPPEAFPKHRNWVATRFNFFVAAYNTNKVKGDQIPKTYEDFLKPEWKGKFAVEAADQEWFATLVKTWGEQKGMDYFQKLSDNKPLIRSGHTLITELVASGEIPIALTVFNHAAESLKRKNAPVQWIPLEPTIGRPNGLALMKHAPHPHAALLFADFLISPEGQGIIKNNDRVPASIKVDTNLNKFKYIMVDPVAVLDEWEKWDKEWSRLILKK
jgi:iron(III) transport system substrate-binding protein